MDIAKISKNSFVNQDDYIKSILPDLSFKKETMESIKDRARKLVGIIEKDESFTIEKFLQEYSLSEDEGIAVMCLAESLIRVPDYKVAFDLTTDKLEGKDWEIGKNKNILIQIASIGLSISSKFVGISKGDNLLTNLINKVSAPIFVTIIKRAIRLFSGEFILAEKMGNALKKSTKYKDYRFAFDLLGESARNFTQADLYYARYDEAIELLGKFYSSNKKEQIFDRPNLSVKFTSLFPRFELTKYEDISNYLMPKLVSLIKKLEKYSISISFDAEEANRLEIYMMIMRDLILKEEFKNFEGIGFVVQAYQKRAKYILEEIIDLSKKTGKKIPVRLVKGAYWDSEIKHAQEMGLKDYPVFTKKEYSDANYIICAKYMIENHQNIYCQFGTHNALTASYIMEMAKDIDFEFQKLFGMGNVLHREIGLQKNNVRIYAPIGEINDLLAYLMRRMLENGANSSFIHQIYDSKVDKEDLIYDLKDKITTSRKSNIKLPSEIYKDRKNSAGYDIGYSHNLHNLKNNIGHFEGKIYKGYSIIGGKEIKAQSKDIYRPGNIKEKIGTINSLSEKHLIDSIKIAEKGFKEWSKADLSTRQKALNNIADLFEKNQFELFNLLIKEAGKSIDDAISEVREAIDFCRYYAIRAGEIMVETIMPSPTGEKNILTLHPRGIFVCISPWNFPLAIFTGQVVAALVTGNSVIAKSAEQTSLVAHFAVKLMHEAGIPHNALNLVMAPGSLVGKNIISSEHIAGVTFTGSTATARRINMSLAERESSIVPLIAETGGQNAMIVDSSALLEQVCDDVIHSSFYSAGQRCSALRILYIQDDIYNPLLKMISDTVKTLKLGDTLEFSNDIGSVIDGNAKKELEDHTGYMKKQKFNILETKAEVTSKNGHFFEPKIIEINSISDVPDENFGPILHVIKYKAGKIDKVIDEINNYGYGLTFGIHSRIESTIEYLRSRIEAGNLYANRSTIGAVVGTHPFGGEKKSGTGFKAGGPNYLLKFLTERTSSINLTAIGGNIELLKLAE